MSDFDDKRAAYYQRLWDEEIAAGKVMRARAEAAEAERDLVKALHDVAVQQRDAREYELRVVERERDAARAEVARLRAVVDAARRARLAHACSSACPQWDTGVCDCGGADLRAALATLDAEKGGDHPRKEEETWMRD